MNLYDPNIAIYGYYSDEAARRFGTHFYETYSGKHVEVSTVVPSHEHAQYLARKGGYELQYIGCLSKYLGPGKRLTG